jgi:peptide/nickel transport system permease protein
MAEAMPTEHTMTAFPAPAPDQEFVTTQAEEQIAVATQWQLMWWRFRKHQLAMAGTVVLILFYLVVVSADFLAYSDPDASEAQRSLMLPQPIQWLDDGQFSP